MTITDHSSERVGSSEENDHYLKEHQRQLHMNMEAHGFYFHDLKEAQKIRELSVQPNRSKPVLGYFNMIGRTNDNPKEASLMALSTLSDYAGKSLDEVIAAKPTGSESSMHRLDRMIGRLQRLVVCHRRRAASGVTL